MLRESKYRGAVAHPTVPHGGRWMKEGSSTETVFELGTGDRRQAQWDGAKPAVGENPEEKPTDAVAIPRFHTVGDRRRIKGFGRMGGGLNPQCGSRLRLRPGRFSPDGYRIGRKGSAQSL